MNSHTYTFFNNSSVHVFVEKVHIISFENRLSFGKLCLKNVKVTTNTNKYMSELFSLSKFDRDTEQPIFLEPQSLMHSSEVSPDAFSCSLNFLRWRKREHVIPFLTGEQANLFTSSFVDWLGDGSKTGDKRKSTEREVYLTFSTSGFPVPPPLLGDWL